MLRKFTITFGTSVIIMFINIVGGILTARFLGPLGKGELTAVTLWPGVLASLGNLGLANAIVYYSGKAGSDTLKTIWPSSFAFGLLQASLLIVLGLLILPVLMHQYSSEVIWIARLYLIFIPLNLLTQYGIAILQGRLHLTSYNTVRFLVTSSYLVIIIFLILLRRLSVTSCAISLLISNLIALTFEVFYFKKKGWFNHQIHFSLLSQMLKYGFKAHIGNVSASLNLRMDQMIMAVMLNADMLGLYVVAVTLSSGVNLLTEAAATLTFPAISARESEHEKQDTFARSLRFSFWSAILVALSMLLITRQLITILFGKEFSGAIPAAKVLIIAASIAGINTVLASGLKGYGKPGISSLGESISLFVTAISLWIFLPMWGILGAAIASLISYSCNFIIMYYFIWHRFMIKPSKAFFPQVEDYQYIHSLFVNLKKNKVLKPEKEV